MANRLDRSITVNGVTFTLGQLINNPNEYFSAMVPLFRPSSLIRKNNESDLSYYDRLFYQLYYKRGYRTNRNAQQVHIDQDLQKSAAEILNILGIDIIKKSKKISKIIFKNSGSDGRIANESLDNLIKKYSDRISLSDRGLDVSFGVELEFVAEESDYAMRNFMREMTNRGYDYEFADCYRHNYGSNWVLGRDCSVRGVGCSGFEFTSPIFKLNSQKDLDQLRDVMEMIKSIFNARTNRSCGTHIHMSFDCDDVTNDLKKHFATSYHSSENSLFDKMVPVFRRENNNRFCKSVSPDRLADRYRKLNLVPASTYCKNMHIEFRQLDGTLEFNKVIAWAKLQKIFIENTLATFKNGMVNEIGVEDVIYSDSLSERDVETILRMSKIAA